MQVPAKVAAILRNTAQRLTPRCAFFQPADNFYLSKDELLHDSPSRRAGVDAETEAQLRSFGCERIQLGVLYLKLPQASIFFIQLMHPLITFDAARVSLSRHAGRCHV